MAVPSPNVAVYTENLVVTPAALTLLTTWANAMPAGPKKDMYLSDLSNADRAADIAQAGFDTIIVGLFHVHEDGAIYYNDFPLDPDTSAAICDSIKALKSSSGSTVQTVLVSFGGGNWIDHPASVSDSDYPQMKANWTIFKQSLTDLLDTAGADGVDWDYEPETVPFDTEFIIRITNEMAALSRLVTAAPYKDMSKWQTVIEGTVTGSAGNNFAWWNLQGYGGADYGGWVKGLQRVTTGLSDAEVEAFLVAGYAPFNCQDSPVPTIKFLHNAYNKLSGAFIWNYSAIKDCAPETAAGLRKIFAA